MFISGTKRVSVLKLNLWANEEQGAWSLAEAIKLPERMSADANS